MDNQPPAAPGNMDPYGAQQPPMYQDPQMQMQQQPMVYGNQGQMPPPPLYNPEQNQVYQQQQQFTNDPWQQQQQQQPQPYQQQPMQGDYLQQQPQQYDVNQSCQQNQYQQDPAMMGAVVIGQDNPGPQYDQTQMANPGVVVPMNGNQGFPAQCSGSSVPAHVKCPNCQHTGITKMSYRPSIFTVFSCLILLVVFFPVAWIPFCIPSCNNKIHNCQSCKAKVGETSAC